MKRICVIFTAFIISGVLLISCQQKESAQQKKMTVDPGVAVQTYDKAVETMDEYKQKGEEAIEQMKESAAGYGEAVKDTAAGYGERAKDTAAGYGEKAEEAAAGYGNEVKQFKFK